MDNKLKIILNCLLEKKGKDISDKIQGEYNENTDSIKKEEEQYQAKKKKLKIIKIIKLLLKIIVAVCVIYFIAQLFIKGYVVVSVIVLLILCYIWFMK